MKFRILAAAIAGVVLLAVSAFSQTATLEGNVKGFDGKPLAGAVIKIVRTDIKMNYQTKTDKKGHYIYMGLAPGSPVMVSVEIDGKQVDSAQGKATISDPKPIDFDLQKSKVSQDQVRAAMEKAAETGQLTPEMQRGMSDEQKEAVQREYEARKKEMAAHKELNDSFNAGMTALEAKQYPQAIEAFEKSTGLDPKQSAIWVSLADAYLADAGTKTGTDKDAEVQKGIDAYNKAIELKPTDAAIHNNYGRALAVAKKYQEAQDEMAKAAQLDPPGAGKYYYNVGVIFWNNGQIDPAVDAFKKSIDADPNYGDAYFQYGSALLGKATADASGKIIVPAGTAEAFQKCIDLGGKAATPATATTPATAPCKYVDDSKAMLTTLGTAVQSQYVDPNKKAAPTATKKGK
jgi:tetratricopeptide (TPR) repeat protein